MVIIFMNNNRHKALFDLSKIDLYFNVYNQLLSCNSNFEIVVFLFPVKMLHNYGAFFISHG